MDTYFHYAFGRRPGEELYDLRTDPDCLTNLAADPAHVATRDQLADRLMTELLRTGDPRVTGQGDTFDLPPFTDVPADARRRQRGN